MVMNPNKTDPSAKPEKNLKEAAMPPLPFEHHLKQGETESNTPPAIEELLNKPGPLTVDEAAELISHLRKKQDALKDQLDEMFQKRGISPQSLRKYMSNPNNFKAQEFENLKKESKELMESLQLPTDLVDEANLSEAQDKTAVAKERSKKGIAQRRGWLPMR